MSRTLQAVIGQLEAEGRLDGGDPTAAAYLQRLSATQPWYVRTMVGFGAWLASLLLIGFVAGLTIVGEGGYAFVGIAFIIAALFVRRLKENDFLVQSSLAVSLAGQVLLAYGFVDFMGTESFETFFAFVIVMSAVLFVVFPDRIHRVIMVLLATGSLTALLYARELNDLVPVLGPLFVTGVVLAHRRHGWFIATGYGELLRPLMNGLMLAAFGCLLLSTVYILPELGGGEIDIYPRPWLSTILLGGLLLYVGSGIWPKLVSPGSKAAVPAIYALIFVIIVSSYAAPGLLLALIIVLLGAVSGHKTFIGAGVGFLAVFLATYFYGIEVSLLTKSITLVVTGTAVLLARWLILELTKTANPGEEDHD